MNHITLTNDQQIAFDKIQSFLESDNGVFILKGYAGTGKTTLLQKLVDQFNETGKNVEVLAPTGRAAKILRDKTGKGKTIHRGIYNLKKFETINDEAKDNAEKSFHYHFPVELKADTNSVCIIDEASMVSDVESAHELFTFGTNCLLTDLLTYMRIPVSGNKLIIVGDPAQLEPVTDSESKALMEEYFVAIGIGVDSYIMKEVVRQKQGSTLLENATSFRKLLQKEVRNEVALQYSTDVIKLSPLSITDKYLAEFPDPKVGDGVIINYSNRQCLSYNQLIRSRLFPNKPEIAKGDLLMINKNNYSTYGIDLYNGTIVEVVDVSPEVETQSAPVYVPEGGKKVRKIISLTFRDVKINVPDYDLIISCKIIDSLLNSPSPDLTVDEMKALYINFNIRFSQQQKARKEKGLPTIERGSGQFKELLESDPYFNALRVKYGYAITCHKSQGGEWGTTFVNFQNRVGIKDAHLRWCYTAMTRARNKMYAINPPNITTLGGLKFSTVRKLGKLPANAIQYNYVPNSPYHTNESHPAKKLKYFEIRDKLLGTPYSIDKVESRDYQEMYYVNYSEDTIRLDATHNGAGVFKKFRTQFESEAAEKLVSIFNTPYRWEITLDYTPSEAFLEKLYNRIQLNCGDLDITITNVIEKKENYYAIYYFCVDDVYASIQFYWNKNQQFSRANPKIGSTDNDSVLTRFSQFLQKLS